MLRPFFGEFLINPVPLHLDLNFCSHNCFYCFANLNNPIRRFDTNILKYRNIKKKKSFVSFLLNQDYPIIVSNTSDPLAVSNKDTFIELHRLLYEEQGISFAYQTKTGNKELEDLILNDKPTSFYVTFTSDNNDLLSKSESGAPSYEHKLEFIQKAKQKGHFVCIGVNPFIHYWWKNFDRFVKIIYDIGIRHVWLGDLHLNYKQIANMSNHTKKVFKQEIQEGTAKKNKGQNFLYDIAVSALSEAGINSFIGTTSEFFNFWHEYRKNNHGFKTLDCWYGYLNEKFKGEPVLFSFSDLYKWLDLPIFESSLFHSYLEKQGQTIRNSLHETTDAKNFKDVLEWQFRFMELRSYLEEDFIYINGYWKNGKKESDKKLTASDVELDLDENRRFKLVFAPKIKTQNILWNNVENYYTIGGD